MTKGEISDVNNQPKDGKHYWKKTGPRHTYQSGMSTLMGMTLWEVNTSERTSFGFYSGTGAGKEDGPGRASHKMVTPGPSEEILGHGLKVRGTDGGDSPPEKAKLILAKRGDIHLIAEDGDIILEAKNIRAFAGGGGQDGNFNIDANKLTQIKSPDIRFSGEKISIRGSNTVSIVSFGFMDLRYGFAMASGFADFAFGSIAPKHAMVNLAQGLVDALSAPPVQQTEADIEA